MPLPPQPGVDIHAGKAVTGGGELALERLAPHLPVAHHRQAEVFLQRDNLADRPVLGRLELSRRKLTPRICLAGGPQKLRPQPATHALNTRMHRHNPQHPPPRPPPPRSAPPPPP